MWGYGARDERFTILHSILAISSLIPIQVLVIGRALAFLCVFSRAP